MSEDKTFKTAQGKLQLQIDDPVAQGIYSNFQVVGSNETEFVLDYAYIPPGQNKGKVRARIILSPKHAKALVGLLGQRIRDFESRFGTIPPPASAVFHGGKSGGGSGLPN
jgi:hypothetical protein